MSLAVLKKNFPFLTLRIFMSGTLGDEELEHLQQLHKYQPLFGAKGFLCYLFECLLISRSTMIYRPHLHLTHH